MYYYVYILQSIAHPTEKYYGFTTDLKARIKKHNEGGCKYTKSFKPWKIETTVAFTSKEKAIKFEKYLKSHSGRAFTSKHF